MSNLEQIDQTASKTCNRILWRFAGALEKTARLGSSFQIAREFARDTRKEWLELQHCDKPTIDFPSKSQAEQLARSLFDSLSNHAEFSRAQSAREKNSQGEQDGSRTLANAFLREIDWRFTKRADAIGTLSIRESDLSKLQTGNGNGITLSRLSKAFDDLGVSPCFYSSSIRPRLAFCQNATSLAGPAGTQENVQLSGWDDELSTSIREGFGRIRAETAPEPFVLLMSESSCAEELDELLIVAPAFEKRGKVLRHIEESALELLRTTAKIKRNHLSRDVLTQRLKTGSPRKAILVSLFDIGWPITESSECLGWFNGNKWVRPQEDLIYISTKNLELLFNDTVPRSPEVNLVCAIRFFLEEQLRLQNEMAGEATLCTRTFAFNGVELLKLLEVIGGWWRQTVNANSESQVRAKIKLDAKQKIAEKSAVEST